jgi:hypothetical protein
MHNRIGRRAAVAGVDRMAVEEDVMASVLHSLLNEGVTVLRPTIVGEPAICLGEPNRLSPGQGSRFRRARTHGRFDAERALVPATMINASIPRAGLALPPIVRSWI